MNVTMFWLDSNDNIEKAIYIAQHALNFSKIAQRQSYGPCDPRPARRTIGTNIFMLNCKIYCFIVDYCSKLLIAKKVDGLSADHLIKICKIVFAEYELPKKIMVNDSTNTVSEKLQGFFRICHIVSSSYSDQSNGQMEAYIKFLN